MVSKKVISADIKYLLRLGQTHLYFFELENTQEKYTSDILDQVLWPEDEYPNKASITKCLRFNKKQ